MNARLALAALGCAVALTVTKHEADKRPSESKDQYRSVLSILKDKAINLSSKTHSVATQTPTIDPELLRKYPNTFQEPGKLGSIATLPFVGTSPTPRNTVPNVGALGRPHYRDWMGSAKSSGSCLRSSGCKFG